MMHINFEEFEKYLRELPCSEAGGRQENEKQ